MSRIELHRLRYFVAVAEELNFGRAAQRLNIAQPPLSQQVAKLEAEIGTKLFYRTKRKVELTLAGKLFLDEARATLAQAAHAVEVARRAARGEIGEIAIGYAASADLNVLPQLVPRFRQAYPDVQLRYTALFQADQISGLRDEEIDVGFLRLPLRDVDDLEVRPILAERMVAVLPAGHRLARRKSIGLAELSGERYIIFPRYLSPGYFDAILQAFAAAKINPPLLEIADHIQFNLSLVAMGEGVSILGESIRNLQRTGVVYVPLEPNPFITVMGMISRRDDRSEVLAKMRETVASLFSISPKLAAEFA